MADGHLTSLLFGNEGIQIFWSFFNKLEVVPSYSIFKLVILVQRVQQQFPKPFNLCFEVLALSPQRLILVDCVADDLIRSNVQLELTELVSELLVFLGVLLHDLLDGDPFLFLLLHVVLLPIKALFQFGDLLLESNGNFVLFHFEIGIDLLQQEHP